MVTLNATASSFNNPEDPVRIAFIAAVAAAANVDPSQVTITKVSSTTPTRRLLSEQRTEFIDVHTTIKGATRLHRLDMHLAGYSSTLHQSHTWEEAHTVQSIMKMRGSIFSTR